MPLFVSVTNPEKYKSFHNISVLLFSQFHSSPVYPTAVNSYSPSHGQRTPNEQHFYKTTIPINEQHCKCNGNGTQQHQAADARQATAANGGNGLNNSNSDVTAYTQYGVSSSSTAKTCQCIQQQQKQQRNGGTTSNATTNTTTIMGMRNSNQTNENHTTTTTTTIEYELSNGVAKLCKISTSRIAAEQQPSKHLDAILPLNSNKYTKTSVETESAEQPDNTSNLPLLSTADLKDLTRNVNAINTFNQNLRHSFSQNAYNLQQRANFTMDCSNNSSLKVAPRDRLGLWGTGGDNDVPGNVSGLQRLQQKKYNKVRVELFFREITVDQKSLKSGNIREKYLNKRLVNFKIIL